MTERLSERLKRPNTFEVLLTVVVVIAALKAAADVMVPFVFALFLIAVFWPLQRRLQSMMPDTFAAALTLLTLLLAIGSVVGILWFTTVSIVRDLAQHRTELLSYARLAEQYGFEVPGLATGTDAGASEPATLFQLEPEQGAYIALAVLGAGGALLLVFGYLVLGLLEFDEYPRRLRRIVPPGEGKMWLRTAQQISDDFQRYMVVRTYVALINGASVSVVSWLIGLDFALLWGLLTFLLSYIPTLGSIVGTILILLYAVLQFDGWLRILLAVLALVAVRFILGNFVNPLVQGKYLKPTPQVVLLSVAFWGWLWGMAGAFIGVPLTILIVIICQQFDRTRWVAVLLADVGRDVDKDQNEDMKEKA